MKKIIVFGATGGTGKQVVEQALQAGNQVTVVVRNPDAFLISHPNLTIIKGDVFVPKSFEEAIIGKDAVVSCLGIQKNVPTTVYSEGVKNITEAMQKYGVHRIICLSAGAVEVSPKSTWFMQFVIKNILQRFFKYLYADMLIMESMLKMTDLNWTIIRPPWLRDSKPTGKYRIAINAHLSKPTKLSRADLADYIIHHLIDDVTFKSTIEISY
jgi:putative NADH-flavin reductase